MRCFLGSPLNIDENIYNSINYDGKKTDRELLHITYYFLGEIDKLYSNYVCSKINSLDIKKSEITVNGIHGFPNDRRARILYFSIDSEDVNNIYKKLVDEINLKKYNFIPHVTIYRFKKFHEVIKSDIKFDITIDRVCLYNSIFKEKRIYNELCCKYM